MDIEAQYQQYNNKINAEETDEMLSIVSCLSQAFVFISDTNSQTINPVESCTYPNNERKG